MNPPDGAAADNAGTGIRRIAEAFDRAADQGRAALIVFLAAGDPDYDTTIELARAAVDAGADIIELGSPFSDPLADGPVIQAAYSRALANGAATARTLTCAGRVAEATGAAVVLMVAYNCVLAYGIDRYCHDAAAAGVSGLLVPDLPVDDAGELRSAAAAAGLGTVFLVGPDSGSRRVAAVAAAATGFVYLLRRRGITGAGAGEFDLGPRVAEARAAGPAPVAVGFGIATPGEAAAVAALADGVIVGSALVAAAWEAGRRGGMQAARAAVEERVRTLATALRETGRSQESTRRSAAATGVNE
jgi:tryptophan synthase alpha chain